VWQNLVFEVEESSGKIRCKECLEADPFQTDWITRAAAKRHLEESNEHAANVRNNLERHAADAARQQRLSAPYSALSYNNFDSSILNPVQPSRPALFEPKNMPDTADDDNNIFHPLDNLIIPAGITPLIDDISFEHERLRREVELLMMEAEQLDEFGPENEDDATLTNIVENMESFSVSCLCDIISVAYCNYRNQH
jgi:hypothetical protein